MTYFHKLLGLIALCTLAVLLAACVDQPDDEASDEIAREIATDEVDDVEIGMSEIQQASISSQCRWCINGECLFYCSAETRYAVALACHRRGRCTEAEYQSFKPRFQEP